MLIEVFNEKMEYEQERKNREIYTTALLISNFVWAKRKPPFERVFKSKKKQMTDEQMFAMVKSLNAAFGGIDKRGEK